MLMSITLGSTRTARPVLQPILRTTCNCCMAASECAEHLCSWATAVPGHRPHSITAALHHPKTFFCPN